MARYDGAPGELILGKVTTEGIGEEPTRESFIFEARPPLTRGEAIELTQTIEPWQPRIRPKEINELSELAQPVFPFGRIVGPLFDYRDRYLISYPNSTLIRFDDASPEHEPRERYARRLETFLGRRLLSTEIPEVAPGRSIFTQREEEIARAQEAWPVFGIAAKGISVRGIVGDLVAALRGRLQERADAIAADREKVQADLDIFNEFVAHSVRRTADRWHPHKKTALVVKSIGSKTVAFAQIYDSMEVPGVYEFVPRRKVRSFVEEAGVEYPDGTLHDFVKGNEKLVIREGRHPLGFLAVVEGLDGSIFESETRPVRPDEPLEDEPALAFAS